LGKPNQYGRNFGYKQSLFGSDTNGHDIKAFGDTTGKYVMWDASADTLNVSGTFQKDGTEITSTAAELNELDISVVGAVSKIKKINMTASDFSDNSEIDTGWDLPSTAVIKNVFINVNTAESTATTKTINIGTDGSGSNDPDGFLAGVSIASTGLVKGTLASGGQTLGALLYVDEDGAGALVPEIDKTSGGESITVTAGDASGFTEADFDIFIEYIEIA
jgi:hypothetical protein